MNNNDVVYFELNNWIPEKDYPATEPFLSWMGNDLSIRFRNEDWVEKNKLCVVESLVDMSSNYCITATKEWVKKNCPNLLTDYQEFLRYPDDGDEDVYGRFGCKFLPYEEQNIGVTYVEENYE